MYSSGPRIASNHSSAGQPLRALLLGLAALAVSTVAMAASAPVVTINDTHAYSVDANTTITLDGVAISATQLGDLGMGFNTQINAVNAGPTASGGNATQVALRNLLKGPVTSIDPLRVLNQPVTANADTILRDIPGNDLANLVAGDHLEVSGVLDANNSIVAGRARFRTGLDGWKLSGLVSGLVDHQFAIGTQLVDFAGITPINCVPALQNGQFVEISMLANAAYTPTSVLHQVTAITCEDPTLVAPPGTTLVSVEGIVSALPDPLPDPAAFSLLGADVVATAQTEYRGGAADDLDVGVRVEVTGFYDAALHTLLAQEIRFVQAQVRFEAPVAPADVVAGDSIAIMGTMVSFNAQTRDQDGIAATGLTAAAQIEVRGLVDAAGNVSATRVRDRGNSDLNDTRLRGPVSLVSAPQLVVLGVTVDTSSTSFRDAAHAPISAAAFFALVQPGTLIEAEHAVYNPATNGLRPGVLTLVDEGLPTGAPALKAGTAAVSRGTVTQLGVDTIYGDSFE